MSKHQTRPKKQELEIPVSEQRRSVTGHWLKSAGQDVKDRIAAAKKKKFLESLGINPGEIEIIQEPESGNVRF